MCVMMFNVLCFEYKCVGMKENDDVCELVNVEDVLRCNEKIFDLIFDVLLDVLCV